MVAESLDAGNNSTITGICIATWIGIDRTTYGAVSILTQDTGKISGGWYVPIRHSLSTADTNHH